MTDSIGGGGGVGFFSIKFTFCSFSFCLIWALFVLQLNLTLLYFLNVIFDILT